MMLRCSTCGEPLREVKDNRIGYILPEFCDLCILEDYERQGLLSQIDRRDMEILKASKCKMIGGNINEPWWKKAEKERKITFRSISRIARIHPDAYPPTGAIDKEYNQGPANEGESAPSH